MCDYLDCDAEPRYVNDGGLWCSFPHAITPPGITAGGDTE